MREEKSLAGRPLRLRGFWLLNEFACKDDASNNSGVPQMQRWIRLSPPQPVPGLGCRHFDEFLPQEKHY
jgi:hypothetical protein